MHDNKLLHNLDYLHLMLLLGHSGTGLAIYIIFIIIITIIIITIIKIIIIIII